MISSTTSASTDQTLDWIAFKKTLAWLAFETVATGTACYLALPSAVASAAIETIIPFNPTNLSSDSRSFIHLSQSLTLGAVLTLGLFAKVAANFVKETVCPSTRPRQIRAIQLPEESSSACQKATQIGKEGLIQIAGIGAQAALIAKNAGLFTFIVRFTQYFKDLPCWALTSRGEELLADCAAWDSIEHTAEQRYPDPEAISKIIGLATTSLFVKVAIPVAIGIFCVRQIPTLFPETASRFSSWLANGRGSVTNHREDIDL